MRIAILAIVAPMVLGGAAIVTLASGCGDTEPEAQQLARMNKELALLIERVDTLGKRVDELESAQSQPADQKGGSAGSGQGSEQASGPAEKTIAIAASGAIVLDGKTVELSGLADALLEGAAGKPASELIHVVIAAEPGTPHAKVVEIIDLIRASGITRIAIQTQ